MPLTNHQTALYWAQRSLALLIAVCSPCLAHEEGPPAKGVRLRFVPPPMEGSISLGIYNSAGQLVRTLHKEAPTSEFLVGLDALATEWDGKDNSGNFAPSGHYQARGFVVGDFDFRGEAFHCNDWIIDEHSPRICKITQLQCAEDGSLLIEATSTTSETPNWWHFDGTILKSTAAPATPKTTALRALSPTETLIDDSSGFNNCSWAIIGQETGCEVRQYSASGEFQRRLSIRAEDPQPIKIAGSPTSDRFYVLEENALGQRVRCLALVSEAAQAEEGTSNWKVILTKSITFSESLDAVESKLFNSDEKPFVPQPSVLVTLRANPLLGDQTAMIELKITHDAMGSYLATNDGLVLHTVTDTPNLRWAAMGREMDSKKIFVFQSDGSVVEEFSASRLANMMAFDCGEFEFRSPHGPTP